MNGVRSEADAADVEVLGIGPEQLVAGRAVDLPGLGAGDVSDQRGDAVADRPD